MNTLHTRLQFCSWCLDSLLIMILLEHQRHPLPHAMLSMYLHNNIIFCVWLSCIVSNLVYTTAIYDKSFSTTLSKGPKIISLKNHQIQLLCFKLFVFSNTGALNYQRAVKHTSPIHACQSRNLPRHLAPTDAPSWLAHEQHVAILRRSHVNKSICWHHSWTDQLSMDHLTKRHNFWELSVVSLTTQKYFFLLGKMLT